MANERKSRPVPIETQKAANVVHGAVGQSLRSQLNKMLSDQRPRSSIDAIRSKKSGAVSYSGKGASDQAAAGNLAAPGKGKTNAEIARALFRSPNTIKLHVSAILKNLDLQNRTQAALLASRLF